YAPERYGEFIPSHIPPYLAFADPTQGEVPVDARFGNLDGDDFPEVVVGRIPAADVAEVATVVAKLLAYEAQPTADWQLRALLVSDNVPDAAGDFRVVLERLQAKYSPPLAMTPIYLNDYCGGPTSPATPCPAGTLALTTTWSAGAGLVTYNGHASVNRWAHEKLLTTGDIATFAPGHGLPFVLSLDCLDGFWMFPESYPGLDDARSIAERLLTTPERGAVAAFSPAGLGYTWDGELVANAVFTALTHHGEFRVAELSQLGRAASRTHMRKVYTLFGDPALVLPFGERITLTPITLTVGSRVTVDAFAPRLDTRFGQTLPFTATAWTADAGTFDRDGAYVAPTTAGAARVTAHLGTLSAAASVTVLAGPPVTLTVSPDPVWLLPGESAQMTATIRDAYLNPVAYTGVITWTSDIGSITPAGRFTAPGLKTEGLITATVAISQGSNTVWLSNHARVTIVASRVYLPLVTR
ncbi:MAG TPA: C25 family cysteine peptidase, partial [Anaerolineae bacterium]|nr:C25 family cysteine peptidase [Anaerolineae bacterium]